MALWLTSLTKDPKVKIPDMGKLSFRVEGSLAQIMNPDPGMDIVAMALNYRLFLHDKSGNNWKYDIILDFFHSTR